MVSKRQTYFIFLDLLSEQHKNALITFNIISLLMNIFANAFLLYAIKKLQLGTTVSYRFIIALTISDLCLGALVQPMFSLIYADLFKDTTISQVMKIIAEFAGYLSSYFSVLAVFLISFDRYLHMKHLNLYNLHMNKTRGSLLILDNLLTSILLAIIITMASLYGFYSYVSLGIIITLAVIFILGIRNYIHAYLSVQKRVAAINVANETTQYNYRADLKFAKGVLIIMLSLVIRYVPFLVLGVLASLAIDKIDKETHAGLACAFFWSIHLMCFGAFVSAVVFFWFNSKLRQFFSMKIPCGRPEEEG